MLRIRRPHTHDCLCVCRTRPFSLVETQDWWASLACRSGHDHGVARPPWAHTCCKSCSFLHSGRVTLRRGLPAYSVDTSDTSAEVTLQFVLGTQTSPHGQPCCACDQGPEPPPQEVAQGGLFNKGRSRLGPGLPGGGRETQPAVERASVVTRWRAVRAGPSPVGAVREGLPCAGACRLLAAASSRGDSAAFECISLGYLSWN